jgi:hypothetical protein
MIYTILISCYTIFEISVMLRCEKYVSSPSTPIVAKPIDIHVLKFIGTKNNRQNIPVRHGLSLLYHSY